MKKVLFVCYGGGHVKMVLPVAKALQDSGAAQVSVLALTTAASVARASGLHVLGMKDFLREADASALAHGKRLAAGLSGSVLDGAETQAYLGLSFCDLVADMGLPQATAAYAWAGRQAFLPVATLKRIIQTLKADLVVATNSPRAERAAIVAARQLGLPSVCLVDLFALDEYRWIGQANYADRVCVLNESVREFLLACGRAPNQVVVTGNPGFDALFDPQARTAGQSLRNSAGWEGQKLLLYALQDEPAKHPFSGKPGDPDLPNDLLERLSDWVLAQNDTVLCVRPRPGGAVPVLRQSPKIRLTGQDWPLPALLHAADMVVTLNSTVGLEGHLVGARLIQVLGSVFDEAMPLKQYRIADEAVTIAQLEAALERQKHVPRHSMNAMGLATHNVVKVLHSFL